MFPGRLDEEKTGCATAGTAHKSAAQMTGELFMLVLVATCLVEKYGLILMTGLGLVNRRRRQFFYAVKNAPALIQSRDILRKVGQQLINQS
jgi:hypothetical protein